MPQTSQRKFRCTQVGLTLMELVVVLALFSILVAVAIPKYVHLKTTNRTVAKLSIASDVKAAFDKYVSNNNGSMPSNTSLLTQLNALPGGKQLSCAVNVGGIACPLKDGSTYLVPTYVDTGCQKQSNSVTTKIYCIGS